MKSASGEVRILIADDHSLLREGLRGLLEAEAGFRVVGEAADGKETLEQLRRLKPEVLLLDLEMPKLTGMDVLRLLGDEVKGVRIIVLAAAAERDQIVEAFRLGARGVLFKDSATESLYECIRTVMAGRYWLVREAVSDANLVRNCEEYLAGMEGRARNFSLTAREMEILIAIVAGKTNREIAKRLSISEQTVKHHVTSIFDKVGAYNRLELALFAIHYGLVNKKEC